MGIVHHLAKNPAATDYVVVIDIVILLLLLLLLSSSSLLLLLLLFVVVAAVVLFVVFPKRNPTNSGVTNHITCTILVTVNMVHIKQLLHFAK